MQFMNGFRDKAHSTLLNTVLWFTEANFTFGVLFSSSIAWRRQTIQRRSPPLQNGDQTIWGGILQETRDTKMMRTAV